MPVVQFLHVLQYKLCYVNVTRTMLEMLSTAEVFFKSHNKHVFWLPNSFTKSGISNG